MLMASPKNILFFDVILRFVSGWRVCQTPFIKHKFRHSWVGNPVCYFLALKKISNLLDKPLRIELKFLFLIAVLLSSIAESKVIDDCFGNEKNGRLVCENIRASLDINIPVSVHTLTISLENGYQLDQSIKGKNIEVLTLQGKGFASASSFLNPEFLPALKRVICVYCDQFDLSGWSRFELDSLVFDHSVKTKYEPYIIGNLKLGALKNKSRLELYIGLNVNSDVSCLELAQFSGVLNELEGKTHTRVMKLQPIRTVQSCLPFRDEIEQWNDAGIVAFKKGDLDTAYQVFRRSYMEYPVLSRFAYNLAITASRVEQHCDVIAVAEVIQTLPDIRDKDVADISFLAYQAALAKDDRKYAKYWLSVSLQAFDNKSRREIARNLVAIDAQVNRSLCASVRKEIKYSLQRFEMLPVFNSQKFSYFSDHYSFTEVATLWRDGEKEAYIEPLAPGYYMIAAEVYDANFSTAVKYSCDFSRRRESSLIDQEAIGSWKKNDHYILQYAFSVRETWSAAIDVSDCIKQAQRSFTTKRLVLLEFDN